MSDGRQCGHAIGTVGRLGKRFSQVATGLVTSHMGPLFPETAGAGVIDRPQIGKQGRPPFLAVAQGQFFGTHITGYNLWGGIRTFPPQTGTDHRDDKCSRDNHNKIERYLDQ